MTLNRKEFLGFLFILPSFILLKAQSYPTGRDSNLIFTKLQSKTENRFSNGTVIGKYKYVDKEGNPVHVKYYANDAGYGVELKSVKVLDPINEQIISNSDKTQKIDSFYPLLPSSDYSNDYQNAPSAPGNSSKYKQHQVNDINKASSKENHHQLSHDSSPDYEIYLQNEVLAPKCGKGKVRIYIDKGKRKIREVLNDVVTFKYFD